MLNKNNLNNNVSNISNEQVYTPKNSCLMFILALFLPYFIYFVFIMLVKILFANTAFEAEVLNGTSSNYISALICQLSLIGGVWYISKNKKQSLFKLNKVSFKLDYVKVLLCLAIGLIALFGYNWLSDMITHVLHLIGYKISESSMLSYGVTNIGMLILCVIVLAGLPAICEELSMRGVILNGFSKKSKNFAILISALMFAIMHLSLEQFIYQFILGVVLATIVYYSGNILYSVILHFFNNAFVLVLNYVSNTALTPTTFVKFTDFLFPILTAVVATVILFVLVKIFVKRCKKTGLKNIAILNKNLEENCELKQNNISTTYKQARDLKPAKLEVLTEKTALILSLSIGIFLWVITVISNFLV